MPLKNLTEKGYPVYGANGLVGYYDSYMYEVSHILIGCRGSCGSVHISSQRSWITGNAISLLRKKDVNIKYVYYALKKSGFKEIITGTSQPQIVVSNLGNKRILIPNINIQDKIVNILEKVEQIKQWRKEADQTAKDFINSVFLEMFGDPVKNEKGFVIKSLYEIIKPERPITYGILKPGPDLANGVPYIRVIDIQKGEILINNLRKTSYTIANTYKRSTLEEGDLLLSIRGHVGRLAVVPKILKGANITQDTARLAPISECNVRYLKSCLESSSMQQLIASRIKGAGVKGINLKDVKKLPIPLPPISEQNKFANIAISYEKLKCHQLRTKKQIQNIFDALMEKVFKGELVT